MGWNGIVGCGESLGKEDGGIMGFKFKSPRGISRGITLFTLLYFPRIGILPGPIS